MENNNPNENTEKRGPQSVPNSQSATGAQGAENNQANQQMRNIQPDVESETPMRQGEQTQPVAPAQPPVQTPSQTVAPTQSQSIGTAQPDEAAGAGTPAQPDEKSTSQPAAQPAIQPGVKPLAASPPAQSAVKPGQPVAQQKPGQPVRRVLTKEEIMNRETKRNRRLVFGCLGSLGCGSIVLLVLIFLFVGQAGTETSALAQSLGINQQDLINSLILIVNLFFGLGALVTFIMTIGGLFKSMMARKDDSETKKKGYVLSGMSLVALVIIIILWVFAWFYLSSKQVAEVQPRSTTLITTPANTSLLTAPIDITFDASGLPFDSRNYDVISYFWDFGDGTSGAGSAVETHRYDKKGPEGRYDVKVTLTFKHKTTGEELTDSVTHTVTIADEKVVAVLEADKVEGQAPLTVNFDGRESTDPDGTIDTYSWDIDGSGFKEGNDTYTYTFEQVGDYTVRLRVTDAKGDYDIAEKKIKVLGGVMPEAIISILNADGDKLFVNKNYTFDAAGSYSPAGQITRYSWDFGDGTTKATTRTAQHTFTEQGVYRVVLTVTDDAGNTAESELSVSITKSASSPEGIIKTIPAKADPKDNFIEGTVPFEVNFDASGSTDPDDDIVDYKWDFDGDGVFDAAGETTSYVYNTKGTYNASLTVIDSVGNEAKTVLSIRAMSPGLQAVLTADPVSGVVPVTVDFDATGSSYSDGQIVSYEWDFGDGGLPRSDVGQVTYKYTKIGNFTAKVKVRTNDSKEETATILISVRQVPLQACFEPSKTVGDAPLTIVFNPSCSTGTIAKYKWDFGDGSSSAEHKPSHTFDTAGSYEVNLEVADAQNVVSSTSEFITVTGELTQ